MYQCTTNLGVLHQEYMPTDLNFLGGMSRLVHYYRGVGQNDNSFTCGGGGPMITILHKGGGASWDH